MAKVCYFTGRKELYQETTVTHAMNQNKTCRKNQTFKKLLFLSMDKPKKVWASARALKSGKVERV